jgi:hypothetical protein
VVVYAVGRGLGVGFLLDLDAGGDVVGVVARAGYGVARVYGLFWAHYYRAVAVALYLHLELADS